MKIILASNNKGKIKEMSQILSAVGHEVISQSEAGYNLNPDETGTSFEENSLIKAKALYEVSKCAVIADDSGLEVDYLNKAPGVYSARYGGENLTDIERYQKVLSELEGVPLEKRTARFVCVITYIEESGNVHVFRGECEGYIGFEPKGENGFGYDPIFYINDKSMAELSNEEKNKISHRAVALSKLLDFFKRGVK
jgi:XTP/dITP diphosphohydrolase